MPEQLALRLPPPAPRHGPWTIGAMVRGALTEGFGSPLGDDVTTEAAAVAELRTRAQALVARLPGGKHRLDLDVMRQDHERRWTKSGEREALVAWIERGMK